MDFFGHFATLFKYLLSRPDKTEDGVFLNFLNFNFKKGILIALLLVLPLFSINMEQKSTQTIWFAQPISFLADSLKSFFAALSNGVRGTTAEYLNLLHIKAENQNLKMQMSALQARMQVFDENQNEIDRLRSVLDFKTNSKMELIPAQIIGRDLVLDHETITINKGIKHGLKSMQAVISVSGVVGYVFRPEISTSHVMLISDRYSVVDALIQKSRSHGILEGQGKNRGILQYVDRTEDVQVGDLIVTGGIDNIFPKGFPLGIVTNVEKKSKDTSLSINTKPVIDANKIEEVFIISNASQEDFFQNSDTTKKE